jgi:hypothetical protein
MHKAVLAVVEARPYLGVSDAEFCVLLSLAEHLNARTGRCFPGAKLIAYDCGRGSTWEATARRWLKRLEHKRLVAITGPPEGGRGRVRMYHLHPKLTPGLKVAAPARFSEWWAPWPPDRNLAAPAGKVAAGAQETWPQRPPNLGSRTMEGNLPTGSTSRVEFPQNRNSTAPTHSYSRMRPYLVQVLAEDDGAEWVEGQGIRLESGKFLRTVQAARKYLDTPDPGSW